MPLPRNELRHQPDEQVVLGQAKLAADPAAIGGLLVNDRVVSAVIHVVLGAPQHPWTFWWAPLLGMLLWAPLHFALDALRLRRRT